MSPSDNPLTMTIPNNIPGYRAAKRASQQQAANTMGLSYGTYISIENGYMFPSASTLILICAYYRCNPDDLYEKRSLVYIGYEEPEKWLKPGAWWE